MLILPTVSKIRHNFDRVLFCLFYKPTNNDIFDDFPMISDHFPKNSDDFLSEGHTNVSEHFPNFPKITKDCRGRSEDVLTLYR